MTKRERRMNAYYYSFEPTGVEAIDRLLSAVACAGKAYHHTDGWTETVFGGEPYEPDHRGGSPVEWIQNAAEDAAAEFRSLAPAPAASPTLLGREISTDPVTGAETYPVPGASPTGDARPDGLPHDPRWRDRPALGEGWRAGVQFCVDVLRISGLEAGAETLKKCAADSAARFPPAPPAATTPDKEK